MDNKNSSFDSITVEGLTQQIVAGSYDYELDNLSHFGKGWTGRLDKKPSSAAVILAGGSGERFGNTGGKMLVEINGRPMLTWSLQTFNAVGDVGAIVVVCPKDKQEEYARVAIDPYEFAKPVIMADAGEIRQESAFLGLESVPDEFEIVVLHDGARPLVSPNLIAHTINVLKGNVDADGVLVAHPSVDTLKIVENGVVLGTPDRSVFWNAQTPQVFRTGLYRRAHALALSDGFIGTDDSSLVERMGGKIIVVEGKRDNLKLTVPEDFSLLEAAVRKKLQEGEVMARLRIGIGYDVHALVEGRDLILGGVKIDHPKGLDGHSDADVLAHAISDAILGALRKGDIGKHFPDTNPAYKNADSMVLLSKVVAMVEQSGMYLIDLDCVVAAQKPKLAPYIDEMRARIAEVCDLHIDDVGIKATTTENLGFVGREEGISAQAVCLLRGCDGHHRNNR